MADWTNSVLVLRDDDGAVLAAMRWDPLAGIDGAFSGIARLTGTAAQWELVSPGDWWAHGAVTGPWIRPVGGREWDVDGRRVAAWMSDPSSVKQSIPHSGYVRTEVRFSSDIDISPLANLATAVAWGLALERVVTEWRAWHPAASIDWHASARSLRLLFAIDGIGVVNAWRGRFGTVDMLAAVLRDSKTEAALAMAPHYVAPAPKAENRDASLRRFADEMRAAKAADRGAA